MGNDRGRYAIAFALRRARKIVRGLEAGLTEDERYAVADHAVAQLKERADPWRLNEEAPRSRHRHDRFFELDGRHPPTPPPSLPFLSPGLPGRGLSFGRPARFEKPVLFFGGKEWATPSRRRIIQPPGNSQWPDG